MTSRPALGVVVLAYGDEPWLAACVDSVLASDEVDVDLVVVDNGCTASDLAPVEGRGDVRIVRPGSNTGFAGGCNLGAGHVVGDYLALVNSDCLVEPDTLAALATVAREPGTGPVMASIRFADRPAVLNSAGNPVHVLGTCWAGNIEEPETRTEPYDVASASGACVLLRRPLWDRLGGFDETYFAYLEDTELSLRCWRLGLAARCVPTAAPCTTTSSPATPQDVPARAQSARPGRDVVERSGPGPARAAVPRPRGGAAPAGDGAGVAPREGRGVALDRPTTPATCADAARCWPRNGRCRSRSGSRC